MEPLSREFYLRDVNTVAPALLGKRLIHRTPEGVTSGVIVEVEAYNGANDKGAHAYPNKLTERTRIQFGLGGYAYVYAIYGLHCCFNVVTNDPGKPEVVLIRALEPVDGVPLMQRRRGAKQITALCSGPGKLCQAMGITKAQFGLDLCGPELYIAEDRHIPEEQIMVSPRVHIEYAQECRHYLWRYYVADNPFVSKVSKEYTARARQYNNSSPYGMPNQS